MRRGCLGALLGMMMLSTPPTAQSQTAAPDSLHSEEVDISLQGRGFTVWITDPYGRVTASAWDGRDITNGIPYCEADPGGWGISPPEDTLGSEQEPYIGTYSLLRPPQGTYRLRVQAVEDCSVFIQVLKRDGGCCGVEDLHLRKGTVRAWTMRWSAPGQDTCWVVLTPVGPEFSEPAPVKGAHESAGLGSVGELRVKVRHVYLDGGRLETAVSVPRTGVIAEDAWGHRDTVMTDKHGTALFRRVRAGRVLVWPTREEGYIALRGVADSVMIVEGERTPDVLTVTGRITVIRDGRGRRGS